MLATFIFLQAGPCVSTVRIITHFIAEEIFGVKLGPFGCSRVHTDTKTMMEPV